MTDQQHPAGTARPETTAQGAPAPTATLTAPTDRLAPGVDAHPAWPGQAAPPAGWAAAPAAPAPRRPSAWRRLPWLLPVVVGAAALVLGLVAGGAGGFALGSTLGAAFSGGGTGVGESFGGGSLPGDSFSGDSFSGGGTGQGELGNGAQLRPAPGGGSSSGE